MGVGRADRRAERGGRIAGMRQDSALQTYPVDKTSGRSVAMPILGRIWVPDATLRASWAVVQARCARPATTHLWQSPPQHGARPNPTRRARRCSAKEPPTAVSPAPCVGGPNFRVYHQRASDALRRAFLPVQLCFGARGRAGRLGQFEQVGQHEPFSVRSEPTWSERPPMWPNRIQTCPSQAHR